MRSPRRQTCRTQNHKPSVIIPWPVRGLESLEKPCILLELIQVVEILEFYKVVLKRLNLLWSVNIIIDPSVVMSVSQKAGGKS